MIAQSKNNFEVFIDQEHLESHFDFNQSGGTFHFQHKQEILNKISEWIGEITLPPETYKSFFGNPTPPPGEFILKSVIECHEMIGWNALIRLKDLPEQTKIEWEIRRGYLTKIFPTIAPTPCHTVVLVVSRFDQKQLKIKIEAEVRLGQFKTIEDHPQWKFVQAPTEWVLLTSYPGLLAPPQSDRIFWDQYGFATGAVSS